MAVSELSTFGSFSFFYFFPFFLSILVNLFCKLILIWKRVWGALTRRTKVKGFLVCLIPLQLHFLFAAIWLEGWPLIHTVWPGQPVRTSPSALQGSPLRRSVERSTARSHGRHARWSIQDAPPYRAPSLKNLKNRHVCMNLDHCLGVLIRL